MTTVPDGAACYFCLGEEADDEGKPLVRDCSCRGDSAGFAHLSCLTKYAEQKCKAAGDRDHDAFTNPWRFCNNCKQKFQGQLAIDLSSAFVSFAEATYSHEGNSKWDKMKVMTALRSKIVALSVDKEMVKVEMTLLTNQLLDTIKQTKKDLNMSGWIHMPKSSEEYQYYTMLSGNFEAFGYKHFGILTEEDQNGAIGHFKKARAIYNLLGMKGDVQHMDTTILMLTNRQVTNQQSLSPAVTSSMLQCIKNDYEQSLNMQGMNSDETITSGLFYAKLLHDEGCHIEAERIVTKVTTVSRRVLGPDHKTTIEADEILKKCKERIVTVLPQNKPFQALRYENDGETCVVTGPVAMPRNLEDERIYHVDSHLVIPIVGCAVICHGLVSASHLNGELGEVRSWKQSETGIRLGVYFEKKGVKSVLVKPENLRIAFELPSSCA